MDANDLCMGCMVQRGSSDVCAECGWREGTLPETPLHMPPRTVLSGNYLIGRVLGQGGFGITYLAWDLNLDRKLAVKEYFPSQCATRSNDGSTVVPYSGQFKEVFEYGLAKFLDEGRTLARFQGHPGIVEVINFLRETEPPIW